MSNRTGRWRYRVLYTEMNQAENVFIDAFKNMERKLLHSCLYICDSLSVKVKIFHFSIHLNVELLKHVKMVKSHFNTHIWTKYDTFTLIKLTTLKWCPNVIHNYVVLKTKRLSNYDHKKSLLSERNIIFMNRTEVTQAVEVDSWHWTVLTMNPESASKLLPVVWFEEFKVMKRQWL